MLVSSSGLVVRIVSLQSEGPSLAFHLVQVINSLRFSLPENVLVLLTILKDLFTEYRNLTTYFLLAC